MPKKRATPSSSRPRAARGRPALRKPSASCHALVPGDGVRVRAQLLKKLKSAERRFEKAQAEWMQHQQVDMPEYRRWHHLILGPLEQDLQRHQSEFDQYQSFLDGLSSETVVQATSELVLMAQLLAYAEKQDDGNPSHRLHEDWSPAFLTNCAYKLWQEPRTKQFDERQERARQERDERREQKGQKRRARSDDDLLDYLADLFDEEFGAADEAEGETSFPTAHKSPDAMMQDIRSTYRKLCRALHPDVAGEATPERHQLWLDVQDAYEARDLARLEALQAAWEMKSDPQGKASTCTRILAATQVCLAGLRSLQRDLRAAKKHLSWQFAVLTETMRAQRAQKIRRQIQMQIHATQRQANAERMDFQHLLKEARAFMARKSKTAPRLRHRGPRLDDLFW